VFRASTDALTTLNEASLNFAIIDVPFNNTNCTRSCTQEQSVIYVQKLPSLKGAMGEVPNKFMGRGCVRAGAQE
jgi:hypothetical protein